MTILVCEDSLMITRAIEFKLFQDGFEIKTAMTGEEALSIMEKQSVDLIIVDLILPKISGMELILKIRNELKLNIPIIVLSKIGAESTILEAFDNGANDYIVKPFSPHELSIRVKRLLKTTPNN